MKLRTIILSMVLIVCMLTACGALKGAADNQHVNGGYQDAALMEEIANDYMNYLRDTQNYDPSIHGTFWVDYCYGVYDDSVPVMITGDGISTSLAERNVEIGNVVIHYRDGASIEVWKNGVFYSMEDAYEQGLLTEDALEEIADIHNNERYADKGATQ